MPQAIRTRPFHAMAKPSGSDCNLRCAYCFYLEKSALYAQTERPRMSEAVLEAYVRDYIASIREEDEVAFTWQGGEPTLLGLDFYRRAARLQLKYGRGRRISNSFQTNGLLLEMNGSYYFDKRIDAMMRLNFFTSVLGEIPLLGELADLADRAVGKLLLAFRVSGTASNPRVQPIPFALFQGA